MSWLSDIGGFLSDSVGDIFNSDIFSTQNILSGLGSFATVYGQQEQAEKLAEAERSKFDQSVYMQNLGHQQAIELLKLKAALGGGGGGGGGGTNVEGIEKLRAMMQAKDMQTNQATQGANLTVQALNNLIMAGQRPIIR